MGVTSKKTKFDIYNSPDGSMFGRAVTKYDAEDVDSGTWKINDVGQYCRKWKTWRGGKWHCVHVASDDYGMYQMQGIGGADKAVFMFRQGDPERLGKESPENSRPETLVAGTYVSTITTNNPSAAFSKQKHRGIEVELTQNGNEITGFSDAANMKIHGTLEGDVISFFTWENDIASSEITGKWKVNPDGKTMTGSWYYPRASGKWDLTRIQ